MFTLYVMLYILSCNFVVAILTVLRQLSMPINIALKYAIRTSVKIFCIIMSNFIHILWQNYIFVLFVHDGYMKMCAQCRYVWRCLNFNNPPVSLKCEKWQKIIIFCKTWQTIHYLDKFHEISSLNAKNLSIVVPKRQNKCRSKSATRS